MEKQGFIIHKATPEKALFDWFYLRSGLVWEDSYFEELRLNLGGISLVKFEKLLKKYKSRKLERVFIFLKKLK